MTFVAKGPGSEGDEEEDPGTNWNITGNQKGFPLVNAWR
jgi:hypothetical protein